MKPAQSFIDRSFGCLALADCRCPYQALGCRRATDPTQAGQTTQRLRWSQEATLCRFTFGASAVYR